MTSPAEVDNREPFQPDIPIIPAMPSFPPPVPKPPKPPCHGQTAQSVEAWLREHIAEGIQVAIRNTQGGRISYKTATVVRLARGRFTLDRAGETGGASFYYSGKNCFHPKGQTRLVIPTPEVIAVCDIEMPSWGFGYANCTV